MGKLKSKGKERTEDKYYRLAKDAGYRARSAFKLIHIDEKYNLLSSSRSVLDLCAAPGGWLQIAVKKVPVGSFVLGVDLFGIPKLRGALTVTEDITTQKCRDVIKKLMSEHGCRAFDLVLHDGSPNIGGAWAQEATSQSSLVIDALKLATQFLKPKGHFVTKIFRSQDYSAVNYCLNQLFEKVEQFKPDSSRNSSAETFLIAKKYLAPSKVDPKLLDIKHLFKGGTEGPVRKDIFKEKPDKRKRGGYPDNISVLRKVISASVFVWSANPLELLGSDITSISFDDPESLSIKNHVLTTEEVKALCDDVGVIGKQDFKHLIKWRMNVRKALSLAKQVPNKTDESDVEDKGNNSDEDDKILKEMEEVQEMMDRKKKREKQRVQKRLAKDKLRKATGMQIDALGDEYVDHELFSLSAIKGKKDLEAVDSTSDNDDNDNLELNSDDETRDFEVQQSDSDIDSDEESRRYDEQMEGILDEAYDRFVNKRDGSSKQRKRAKRAFSEANKELMEEDDDAIENSDNDNDSDKDPDQEANPLVLPMHEDDEPTKDELAEKWFSQDIFTDAIKTKFFEEDEGNAEMEDVDEEKDQKEVIKANKHNVMVKKTRDIMIKNTRDTMVKNTRDTVVSNRPKTQPSKIEEDIEIVPEPDTDSSDDSSSDESELEDYEKAEILATARKMMRKKQRDMIIDDGYNKYTFDDDEKVLPVWFKEEEKKHRQPMKPVTKDEVNAMKAKFKEVDARPTKKVAQAKARKKRVADRKLEKIRKKANTINDQTDLPERSKGKMIDKLYKSATPQRAKKEYVVAKKGVQVKTGKGKVLVDRRMKKDLRAQKGKKGKSGGSKGGKGGAKGKGSSKPPAKRGKMGSRGK